MGTPADVSAFQMGDGGDGLVLALGFRCPLGHQTVGYQRGVWAGRFWLLRAPGTLMPDADDIRAGLAEAHDRGAPGSSSATAWMMANARTFAAELSNYKRPNWRRIAEIAFKRWGVCAKPGRPMTGVGMRRAWLRVREYLIERGEDWVEIKDPPRGRGARRVRRKKAVAAPVAAPVVAVERATVVTAPVAAPVDCTPPERSGGAGLREMLARRDRARGLPNAGEV